MDHGINDVNAELFLIKHFHVHDVMPGQF